MPARCDGDGRRGQDQDPKHQVRASPSPPWDPVCWARRSSAWRGGRPRARSRGPAWRGSPWWPLLCTVSLRCSADALAAAPWRLWAGVVSIAAEAAQTRRKVAAAGNEDECDLFDGEWVRPDGGDPLYDSRDCPFLDVGFHCSENGCPDAPYTKWRWQPARCDLPRWVDSDLLLVTSSFSSIDSCHPSMVTLPAGFGGLVSRTCGRFGKLVEAWLPIFMMHCLLNLSKLDSASSNFHLPTRGPLVLRRALLTCH